MAMQKVFETSALDDALLEFGLACPFPSVEDVREWEGRYPEFAREIRASAVETAEFVLSDRFAEELELTPEDEALADRVLERVMADMGRGRPSATLKQEFRRRGMSIDDVARAMDVDGDLLEAVASGSVATPASGAFRRRLAGVLQVTVEAVASLHEGALQAAGGHLSAASAPEAEPMTFAQAVAATGMTDERKRFWLGED